MKNFSELLFPSCSFIRQSNWKLLTTVNIFVYLALLEYIKYIFPICIGDWSVLPKLWSIACTISRFNLVQRAQLSVSIRLIVQHSELSGFRFVFDSLSRIQFLYFLVAKTEGCCYLYYLMRFWVLVWAFIFFMIVFWKFLK